MKRSLISLVALAVAIVLCLAALGACTAQETPAEMSNDSEPSVENEQPQASQPGAAEDAADAVDAADAPVLPTSESADYDGPIKDYATKQMWFDASLFGGGINEYALLKSMGDEGFDIDALVNSEHGELILEMMMWDFSTPAPMDFMSNDTIQYWKEQGVTEKVYNAEDPEHVWVAFAPDTVLSDTANKYPIIFDFHGNEQSPAESISHGFVQICKENGFMVVCPENENSEPPVAAEYIDICLDQLESDGWPIDRSRVYTVGMSKGGRCSVTVALMKNDMIAAAAANGSTFSLNPAHEMCMLTPEMYKETESMPLLLAAGEFDLEQLPFPQETVDGLNMWLEMNGCNTAEADSSSMLGIIGDNVYTIEKHETDYNFVEFADEEGRQSVVVCGVENMPHWVPAGFAQFAWDFLKQYSLDENGERVYTPNE